MTLQIKREMMRYEQVREDFERLVEIHDGEYPYDWTGGFVFEEHAMELMQNPTKAKAAKIYRDAIVYSSYSGFAFVGYGDEQAIIKNTEEVREIYKRYGVGEIEATGRLKLV
jgi:hypothetical protein